MKIRELIAELQTKNQEQTVVVATGIWETGPKGLPSFVDSLDWFHISEVDIGPDSADTNGPSTAIWFAMPDNKVTPK